jgi:hypothetical protein
MRGKSVGNLTSFNAMANLADKLDAAPGDVAGSGDDDDEDAVPLTDGVTNDDCDDDDNDDGVAAALLLLLILVDDGDVVIRCNDALVDGRRGGTGGALNELGEEIDVGVDGVGVGDRTPTVAMWVRDGNGLVTSRN